MRDQVNRTPLILGLSLLSLVIGAAWYLVPHPAVAIGLAFIPLGALFVINKAFWFVILFVVFSFFRIHEALPVLYPMKIPLLLSMGALSALLWHSLVSRELKISWHHSLNWLVIFWILTIIGIVFASNRPIALAEFKGIYWKIIVMTLAITWLVNTTEDLAKTAMTIIYAGALVSTIAVYNSINGIGLVEGTRVTIGRDFGSMLGDPNDLALVLMFPLAFTISQASTSGIPLFKRIISGFVCVLLLAAIIATQSRGGLLGCIAVIGIFAWKLVHSKLLLMSGGAIAAVVLYLAAGISDRASGGAAEEGIDESAMGRIYAWEAAFKMALDNPLTGVGLDNFYSNYFFYSAYWDGLNHAVHSTWFGVLAETGFIGLIIFVGLIVSLIKTSRATLAQLKAAGSNVPPELNAIAYAVYAGLIGTIVSGTFLTQGFNWPIYILAALTVCVSNVSQTACQNEKI
ncbi:Membrane protein SypL involved in exopolysaccharide production [Vibrio chagasii]|uniref:O-antigen ligase family protein n=1 Tax=Vibrio TaxID=662 RepID=UPI00076A5126|nr:O-antigen ligase family protein [Vibrio splendidus]CAH6865479.1 Membrane protein SypL involved in exopolysaccharide production [Vibrio chagasii]CAH7041406.1 Membrane protein SypL involved in exopolysaccharide production [Vibrio chagasii]CAH7481523.1 Membrane protein SypL involved in exopolysaccharide production [Vibrio chagasii]